MCKTVSAVAILAAAALSTAGMPVAHASSGTAALGGALGAAAGVIVGDDAKRDEYQEEVKIERRRRPVRPVSSCNCPVQSEVVFRQDPSDKWRWKAMLFLDD